MKKTKIHKYSVRGITPLLLGLLLLVSNLVNAQSRQLFNYEQHPILNAQQQHYADAWTKYDWVQSYKFVTINSKSFNGNFLAVNLPGNVTINVEKNELIEHSNEMISWKGTFQNPLTGNADFVIHNDMITARISCANFVYLVYPITDNMHVLIACNGARMPQDESEEGYKNMLEQGIKSAQHLNDARINPETGAPQPPSILSGDCKVRILVAYTATTHANLPDPIAFVQSCIDATNTAYNNSLVNFNVELAVAIEEVYPESLNSATDKVRFHDTADGYMDDVHDYRTYFDADMCILITENLQAGICGEAYTVANSTYTDPFCVVTRGCAVGNLSFPHELGHLYGCRHDTYVDATTTPYAYGHGYVYLAGQWRTVMAYNNYCSDNGSNCTRLQYFSNPGVIYSGHVMGTSTTNDNESALESSRANISSLETTLSAKVFVNNYYFSSGEFSDVIATTSVTNNNTDFYFYSGSKGTWRTGSYCDLKPGFTALAGCNFTAYIDQCTALRPTADNTVVAPTPPSNSINDEAQVQPNPFNDQFDLVYNLGATGNVKIQLFDMTGKKVRDLFDENLSQTGPYKFTFNVADLQTGIYMCVINSASGIKTIRISKAN